MECIVVRSGCDEVVRSEFGDVVDAVRRDGAPLPCGVLWRALGTERAAGGGRPSRDLLNIGPSLVPTVVRVLASRRLWKADDPGCQHVRISGALRTSLTTGDLLQVEPFDPYRAQPNTPPFALCFLRFSVCTTRSSPDQVTTRSVFHGCCSGGSDSLPSWSLLLRCSAGGAGMHRETSTA